MTQPYGITPPAYRLPSDLRLGVVRLQVADLDRSLEWYGRVLGPRVLEHGPPRAVLAAADGRPLIELRERPGARALPRRGRLGLYHYALLLPDRASLARFVQHLSVLGERAGTADHLVSEAIYLSDPDGLGIEVYADRPRSAWRFSDRQLVMATNPLDVRDLLGALEGGEWNGLPAGTVIGHVHLYVGDLAAAEVFYHRALGLDKVVWSYPGALFLSAGGYHHHLGTNTWALPAGPAAADDARLLEWELVLPSDADVRAAVASFEAAGVAAGPETGTVEDPWGTVLRLRSD